MRVTCRLQDLVSIFQFACFHVYFSFCIFSMSPYHYDDGHQPYSLNNLLQTYHQVECFECVRNQCNLKIYLYWLNSSEFFFYIKVYETILLLLSKLLMTINTHKIVTMYIPLYIWALTSFPQRFKGFISPKNFFLFWLLRFNIVTNIVKNFSVSIFSIHLIQNYGNKNKVAFGKISN